VPKKDYLTNYLLSCYSLPVGNYMRGESVSRGLYFFPGGTVGETSHSPSPPFLFLFLIKGFQR